MYKRNYKRFRLYEQGGFLKKVLDATKVYDRIKEDQVIPSDAALARFFGKSPQTLSNWKGRNSVQLELILAKCPKIDLNWLFRGIPLDPEERKEIKAHKARQKV